MSENTVAKVTISLSQELLEVTDRLARERKVSRSRVIADLIEREMMDQERALMAMGYRETAQESRRLAQDAFPTASDGITKNTTWDDTEFLRYPIRSMACSSSLDGLVVSDEPR